MSTAAGPAYVSHTLTLRRSEALYEEQVKHFRQSDGTWRTAEFDELRQLPILDSVIRETLRIHPPIHSIMRGVREDVVVPPSLAAPSEDGRYVIPKGHVVLSSAAISQVDPLLWKNAETWDPARWSDPEGVAAQAYKQYDDAEGAKVDFGFGLVSKGTESPYQPFGAGRHRCIGEQFAYLQLGTIIATIIRQVELRLPANVRIAVERRLDTVAEGRHIHRALIFNPQSAKPLS